MSDGISTFNQACDGLRDCISAALDASRARLVHQPRPATTVVQAPIGYGKTLLLAAIRDSLGATHECVWVELKRGVTPAAFAAILENVSGNRPRALFIHGVAAGDSELVSAGIDLAAAAGTGLRTFIATSHSLLAGSGSFAGGEDVSVLGHRDLTVTSDQFRKDALAPMQRRQLRELLAHTGGWPIALRLARMNLKRIVLPDGGLDLEVLDEPLRAYVEMRLRSTLPEKTCRELSVLASLGTVSVPPRAPRQLLKLLAELPRQAVLDPLLALKTDPGPTIEWNPAFRRALVASLHPEDYETSQRLNRELVRPLAACGERFAAIECARLGRDDERLGTALEQAGGWHLAFFKGMAYADLFDRGSHAALSPAHWPRVQLGKIYSLLRTGLILEGAAAYDELRRCVQDLPAQQRESLRTDFAVFDVFISIHRRKTVDAAVIQELEQELPAIIARMRPLAGGAIALLCASHFAAWNFSRAAHFTRLGMRLCDQSEYLRMLLVSHGVTVHILLGNLPIAERSIDSWSGDARLFDIGHDPTARFVDLAAAHLAYVTGRLQDAQSLLEDWEAAFDGTWIEFHLHSAEMMIRMALRTSGPQRALAELAKVADLAADQGAFYGAFMGWLRAEIQSEGTLATPLEPLRLEAPEDLAEAPESAWRMLRAYRDTLALRSLPLDDVRQEEVLMTRALAVATTARHVMFSTRLHVLYAARLLARGKRSEATSYLRQRTSNVGHPFLRTVLAEEGIWLGDERSGILTSAVFGAAAPGIPLPEPDEASPFAAQLSPREREILGLIAEGLSSKEIATKLQVGIGTVKTFRIRLYKKIKVSRRSGAVAVARLLRRS